MTIKGGLKRSKKIIELTLSRRGGHQYTRVFDDTVQASIDRFDTDSSLLLKITNHDTFMHRLMDILKYAHIDMIHGEGVFQRNIMIWTIHNYLRMLLDDKDMKSIAQLLNLDEMLYSMELSAELCNEHIDTDFDVPNKLKITNDTKSVNDCDSIDEMVKSIKTNLKQLNAFIKSNIDTFKKIHRCITKAAANQLA